MPRNDSPVQGNTTPSRLQCSPVTPYTKVPWIEISQLPDVSKDSAYFEACSDLDSAWTTQSFPNLKYVPERTPEHETRVGLLLQGIKDYVAAESDDWVAYVNGWLGSTLPPSKIESKTNPGGDSTVWFTSFLKDHALTNFGVSSKILGVYGRRYVSAQGEVSKKKDLSISGLTSDPECLILGEGSAAYRAHCKMGRAAEKLCITPIDVQKAFENKPGYLFRPMSVRTSNRRPNVQELAELGGQWFGYEVHVFDTHATGGYSGLMMFGFGFKPCASRIQIDLKKNLLSTPNAK
ncbi:MAG: hypothetical protein WAW73_06745 [Rhodoferax sp.]